MEFSRRLPPIRPPLRPMAAMCTDRSIGATVLVRDQLLSLVSNELLSLVVNGMIYDPLGKLVGLRGRFPLLIVMATLRSGACRHNGATEMT